MEKKRVEDEKERLAEAAIIGSHTSLGKLSAAIRTEQGKGALMISQSGADKKSHRSGSSYEDSQLLDDLVGEINEKSSRLE